MDEEKIHKAFHDVLGELTVIRTALWELKELSVESNKTHEVYEMADKHCQGAVEKILTLKNDILEVKK